MDPIYNESRPLVLELKILKDFVLPYLAYELDHRRRKGGGGGGGGGAGGPGPPQ